MNIIKLWHESVFSLKFDNLKMLFLVTLNMIRREYKFIISMFCLLFLFYFRFIPQQTSYMFFYLPLIFALFLRPSIKNKNFEYIWDNKWHFVYWFILHLATVLILYVSFVYLLAPVFVSSYKYYALFIIYFIGTVIFFNLSILIALFWLDSRVSARNLFLSFWRAIKMLIFNLPVYLTFFILFFLLDWLFLKIFFFSSHVQVLMFAIILIFYICLQVNLYTKNIHDKFYLYFD